MLRISTLWITLLIVAPVSCFAQEIDAKMSAAMSPNYGWTVAEGASKDFFFITYMPTKKQPGYHIERWSLDNMTSDLSADVPASIGTRKDFKLSGILPGTGDSFWLYYTYIDQNELVVGRLTLSPDLQFGVEEAPIKRLSFNGDKPNWSVAILASSTGAMNAVFAYSSELGNGGYDAYLWAANQDGVVLSDRSFKLPNWKSIRKRKSVLDEQGNLYVRFSIDDDKDRGYPLKEITCTVTASSGEMHVWEPPKPDNGSVYYVSDFAFLEIGGKVATVEPYHRADGVRMETGLDYRGILLRIFNSNDASLQVERSFPIAVPVDEDKYWHKDPAELRFSNIDGYSVQDDHTIVVYGEHVKIAGQVEHPQALFALGLDIESGFGKPFECPLPENDTGANTSMYAIGVKGGEQVVLQTDRGNIGSGCTDEKTDAPKGGARDVIPAIVQVESGPMLGLRRSLLPTLPENPLYLDGLYGVFPGQQYVFAWTNKSQDRFLVRVR